MKFSTDRLTVRPLVDDDAPFIFSLMTSEDCIKNIGDRGLKSHSDALQLMHDRYMSDYPNLGLFVVELTQNEANTETKTEKKSPSPSNTSSQSIGTVSFLKRDYLDVIDIGYAFLPEFYGYGFAIEATKGLLQWAKSQQIKSVCAVVNPDNSPSINLLKKLSFQAKGEVTIPGEDKSILYFELSL